jgi:hypothetical protein
MTAALGPVERVRHGVAVISIVRPTSLAGLVPSSGGLALLPPTDPFDAEARGRLKDALADVGHDLKARAEAGVDVSVRDVLKAPDPHDAYFRVVRVPGSSLPAFRRGVLQALAIWCGECADRPVTAAGASLGHALMWLWTLDLGTSTGPATADEPAPSPRPAPEMDVERAVRRWLRGHQIFAVLTQGLTLVVQALHRAARHEDRGRVERLLRCLAQLYLASGAALRFTAEFPRAHYEQAIRPSMTEPLAPAGFSGTLSSDHASLVRALMAAKPAFDMAVQRCPQAHALAKQALASMYADHKLICERMAGLDQPSIRSATLTQEQHSSGALLDRFQERRSQLLR